MDVNIRACKDARDSSCKSDVNIVEAEKKK
jgi:hypothetical protein